MRDFFRGWKRKVGVATLVVACVYTGIAVISIVLPIRFTLSERDPHSRDEVGIVWGLLVFRHVENFDWNDNLSDPDSDRNFLGFLWELSTSSMVAESPAFLFIPCWPIVLPLTGTSALLLSKPRPTKPDEQQST